MNQDILRLVIMGPPGAGKGTQGKAIAERLGIAHISTGDILRAEIESGSEIGLIAGALIDKGEFVQDGLITEMVLRSISRPQASDGYILDGFPRTLVQARDLVGSEPVDAVVQLCVPDEELIRRIATRAKEGRADDTPEILTGRLRIYRERTLPIIDFFEEMELVVSIDGTRVLEDVTEDILQRITPFVAPLPT